MKRYFLAYLLGAFQLATFATSDPAMLLRLQANGQSMFSETVVYFEQGASSGYDPLYDAPSLGAAPGQLLIVSVIQGTDFQVKGMPALTQGVSIPLRVTTGTTGNYQLTTDGMQNLPQGCCVFLHDEYNQASWDLRNGAYSCTISDTETVARFSLNIITSQLNGVNVLSQAPTCSLSANGMITASVSGTGPWNYYWKDSANNIIRTTLNSFGADSVDALNTGSYRVDVNPAGTCANSVHYFTLEGAQSPKASFQCDTLVNTSETIVFTSTSVNADNYWWDMGDGMGYASEHTSHDYYAPAVYTVSLTATSSICNESSVVTKEILVTGSTGLAASIAEPGMFIGSDVSGYFVKFDSEAAIHARVVVTDLLGKTLMSVERTGLTSEKIYLDAQVHGVFVVSVLNLDTQEILSGKFVK